MKGSAVATLNGMLNSLWEGSWVWPVGKGTRGNIHTHMKWSEINLVPRPTPAFRHLQSLVPRLTPAFHRLQSWGKSGDEANTHKMV